MARACGCSGSCFSPSALLIAAGAGPGRRPGRKLDGAAGPAAGRGAAENQGGPPAGSRARPARYGPAKADRRSASKTGTRITLIGPMGDVLVDSDKEDSADMDNHGQRPEVEVARPAPFGMATRYSSTLQKNLMYVALHTPEPGEHRLRARGPAGDRVAERRQAGCAISSGARRRGPASSRWCWPGWLARRLAQPLQELTEGAEQIAAGDYGHRVYLDRKDELGQLADTFNHMSTRWRRSSPSSTRTASSCGPSSASMVEGVIAIDAEQTHPLRQRPGRPAAGVPPRDIGRPQALGGGAPARRAGARAGHARRGRGAPTSSWNSPGRPASAAPCTSPSSPASRDAAGRGPGAPRHDRAAPAGTAAAGLRRQRLARAEDARCRSSRPASKR